MGFLRFAVVASSFSALVTGAFAAPRWDFSDYPSQEPTRLFRMAWDGDSPAEKLRIRSWLAARHADKPEGLFSRAWLAGKDGDGAAERRLYQECVNRYPTFAPCLVNGASAEMESTQGGQSGPAAEALLSLTPTQLNPDDDVTAFRNGYFFLINTKRDVAGAASYLARFRAQHPQAWSLDFVEGLGVARSKPMQALELYKSAINKGGRNIDPEVFERLMDLETGVLYDQAQGKRFDIAARRVLQYYRTTGNWRSNSLVLSLLKNHVEGTAARANLVQQFEALGLKPSLELLNEIDATVASSHPEWASKLRRQLGERARVDPTLNAWLGQMALLADNQPSEATRLFGLAIDAAYGERQRSEFANWIVFRLRMQGDCQAADREAKSLLARYGRLNERAEFFSNWFEAQLCVGDLSGARSSLVRRGQLGASAGDLVSDEARLAMVMAEASALSSDRGQDFLSRWQAGSDGKLTLQIEFPSGSAQIPSRFDAQLKQVADALKQTQAGEYVFEVAGHTDNTGDAALNVALSQRRAQAIVEHLIQRYGLSSLRLRANGYGSVYPVADNASDSGRQRNRRVEITPISSASAPTIARAGRPTDTPTISPDGRLLLDGDGVLWDTRQWIALRRLPDFRMAEFSRDGRYVIGLSTPAIATMDGSVWVYSLATNKVVARRLLGPDAAVESFGLSPDGLRLAMVRMGLLEVLTLPDLKRQAVTLVSHTPASGKVAWLGNDRVAVAARHGGAVLQVMNANTLVADRRFDDADYVHTVGTSSSGRYLVAGLNDGRLLVWDTVTWQRREIARSLWNRYSTSYRFHPLREQMVADQWNGSSGHTTVLVDLDTLRVSRAIAEGKRAGAAYAPDGESLFVAGSPVKRLDLRTLEQMPLPYAEQPALSVWSFVRDHQLMASYDFKQSQVWDVATARPQHRLKTLGSAVYGVANQRWTMDEAGKAQAIAMQDFQLTPLGQKPEGYDGWRSQLTAGHWVMTRNHDVRVGSSTRSKEGELVIIERIGGKVVGRHRFPLVTEDFIHSDDEYPLESSFDAIVSSDGRYVAVRTEWKEHWGYPSRSSKVVQLFELTTGQRAKRLVLAKPVSDLYFPKEQPGVLLVRTDDYIDRYEVASERFGTGYPVAKIDRLMFDDGQRRIMRNRYYITHVRPDGSTQVLPVSGAMDGMALPASNLLLLEFAGELRYYELKTLTHQLSVLSRSNGEWIAYTPDGHYNASAQGTAGLYWSLGEATLPFAAFKEKFEKPNLVRERLQGLLRGQAAVVVPIQVVDNSQAVAQAAPASTQTNVTQAAQLDTNFFDPPFKLRVIDAPKAIDGPTLILKLGITKTRAIDAEPSIELNVNGQQIEPRGLARLEVGAGHQCTDGNTGAALKLGCEVVRNLPLALEEGRNVVVVNAFFKGGRAQPEVLAIERRKAAAIGPRPNMWFFGVGVSQYNDPSQNLQFAHRDAQELAAAFARQEGKLYGKVNTKVLMNQAADARTVKGEMNRFLRQASSQDLIVIFLAGHGMQDNDQTLYFMTADSNLAEPFTGIGISELQDFLRRRPMSQKALLLLDICHAGAAAGQLGRRGVPSGDDVINQLVNGTGVKVLASSQGREFSLEQPQFRGGHGAFTAALLEGLEGKARSGGSPVVSVLDLERYVSRRVPELTRGKQHPTAPDSNNFQDYPLAVQ